MIFEAKIFFNEKFVDENYWLVIGKLVKLINAKSNS